MVNYPAPTGDFHLEAWHAPNRDAVWRLPEQSWPDPDICVTDDADPRTGDNEQSIMAEIAHLIEMAESISRPDLIPFIRFAQALALRIAAKANIPLSRAGFLSEEAEIEFILANPDNGRRVSLDLAIDREGAWAHLVSSQHEEGGTVTLTESSSVEDASNWLCG